MPEPAKTEDIKTETGEEQKDVYPFFFVHTINNYLVTHQHMNCRIKGAATRENWSSGFQTRSDTNRPVQSQKKARGWKF